MKIKLIIIFLLGFTIAYSQAPLNFSARMNVTNVTGSDPYTIVGIIQDDLSLWSAADLNTTADSIYHLEGSDLLIYRITTISSAVGNNFTIIVDDIMDSGILPSNGTEWCAVEFTTNYQFPMEVGNLATNFKGAINNRFKQRLDTQLALASTLPTDGIYTPTIDTFATDTVITIFPHYYEIGDSIVTVTGKFLVNSTAGTVATSVQISLPPGGTSNFTSLDNDVNGQVFAATRGTPFTNYYGYAFANTSTDKIEVSFKSDETIVTDQYVEYIIKYVKK